MQTSRIKAFFASLMVLFGAAQAQAETELLMVEEEWCEWCRKWNAEVGHIYHKTAEGRVAPLRRTDIHEAIPDDVHLKSGVHFTPTFVLLQDGHEIGRIEGYPGEDFFWGLLQMLIDEIPSQENDSASLLPGKGQRPLAICALNYAV